MQALSHFQRLYSFRSFVLLAFILFLSSLITQGQSLSIQGSVKGRGGSPVAGASLVIKGSNNGTSTDSLGFFQLNVKRGDSLVISAIGFFDTTLIVSTQASIIVGLTPKTTMMANVVVNPSQPNGQMPAANPETDDEIITGMLNDYARGALMSEGTIRVSGAIVINHQLHLFSITYTGFGPLNTINNGLTLPVYNPKEETRGSRYLLNSPARGVVVNQANQLLKDSSLLLNFDKLDGKLLVTKDQKAFLEVDKEKVKGFALKTGDTSFVFVNVPVIDNSGYYVLVSYGETYSIYKSISTKFVKSNFQTTGLIEKGNNYDEYVDNISYFLVDNTTHSFARFELRKKSLKAAVAGKSAGEQFLNDHKQDDINDGFLAGLNNYMNAQIANK